MKFEILTPDGRLFTRKWLVPYTTKDGRKIKMMEWESTCVDCEKPFTVLAFQQVMDYERSRSFGIRRCKDCIDAKPIKAAQQRTEIMRLLVANTLMEKNIG